jgi:hypothetical protein
MGALPTSVEQARQQCGTDWLSLFGANSSRLRRWQSRRPVYHSRSSSAAEARGWFSEPLLRRLRCEDSDAQHVRSRSLREAFDDAIGCIVKDPHEGIQPLLRFQAA